MTNRIPAWTGVRDIARQVARVAPGKAAVAVLLLLLLPVVEGGSVLLLGPLLEQVVVIDENPLPRVEGWFAWILSVVGSEPSLSSLLLLFVALSAAKAVLQLLRVQVVNSMREAVVHASRSRLYRAIASAEWRFLVTRTPPEFVHALSSEVTRVGGVVTTMIELAAGVLVTTVYLGLALRLSPLLALIVLACAAPLAFILRSNVEQASALGGRAADARRRLHRTISEHVAGLKTARVYGTTDRHADEIDELSLSVSSLTTQSSAAESRFQYSLEIGSTVLLAIIVFLSVTVIEINPALLLVLVVIFGRLMPRLIQIYRLTRSVLVSLPLVHDVDARVAECLDAAEAPASPGFDAPLHEGVAFEAVSFAYLRRLDRPAVNEITLRIPARQTTAIIGPSGAGKSTLADLLIGVLTPSSGRIVIDGRPLDSGSAASWRRQVGYVAQDTFLFHDSIRANLAWARPDATEAELWHALQLAAARDFVADLPRGLDTVIGERGVLLSGGERQRLSIARALLRGPSVLILDEATSSLDIENERRIQEAIDNLQHQLTIIIITHRLTTVRHADVIHVMEHGRVVQSGSWEALAAERGGQFDAHVRQFTMSEGMA